MTEGTGGIVNVGLTCYANAVIQAFRHCYNIKTLFQEGTYNKLLKEDCKYSPLTIQLANIIQSLSRITSSSSIRPNGFWNAFHSVIEDSCFEHLKARRPHDAHEFLMAILDYTHESLSKKVTVNITKCELLSQRQKLHQASLESWKSHFENEYSPFVDLFFGLFHIQTLCSNCKTLSHKFETFNTLKCVFPKDLSKPTILQCIHGELNEEIIEEYSCDVCSPKRYRALRKTKIWKLPQNLILVLKRFDHNFQKIHTPIEHLIKLDLGSIYSELSPNKKNSKYSLRSIVDHHGSMNGGHYTAQAKHTVDSKWYLYDDQDIHAIDSPIMGESSYILFFEKE